MRSRLVRVGMKRRMAADSRDGGFGMNIKVSSFTLYHRLKKIDLQYKVFAMETIGTSAPRQQLIQECMQDLRRIAKAP